MRRAVGAAALVALVALVPAPLAAPAQSARGARPATAAKRSKKHARRHCRIVHRDSHRRVRVCHSVTPKQPAAPVAPPGTGSDPAAPAGGNAGSGSGGAGGASGGGSSGSAGSGGGGPTGSGGTTETAPTTTAPGGDPPLLPHRLGVDENDTPSYSLYPTHNPVGAGDVEFDVTNFGQDDHDFSIRNGDGTRLTSGPVARAGGTATFTVTLPAGSYTLYCSLPGHEAAGMNATLSVQ